ncbi:MAG TPA: hypothetical protein DCF63_20170 [Planctomycetaceae bacterium]|nr:hypothetical protein [Planctomycetaceae bacterium]
MSQSLVASIYPRRLTRATWLTVLLGWSTGFLVGQEFTLGQWNVGVARAEITPTESVPLAGYGGPTRMSLRVDHPIWLKALALQYGSGDIHVLVTADLVGLSEQMVQKIAGSAKAKHGLERHRLILNASHNHSCPVTADVLWLYYELTHEQALARDRYTDYVYQQYAEVIDRALANIGPAELHFGHGLAGIAVNRRRSRGPDSRSLPGPVDHDVPVLTVISGDQIKAIVFGYSCHTTALGGLSVNGDYAGFAQISLERSYSGAICLFVQNCGGDANPLPRIRGKDRAAIDLAAMYGEILAEAVRQTVQEGSQKVSGPLQSASQSIELSLQPGPSRPEIQEQLPRLTGMQQREYQHFLNQYTRLGKLPSHVPYPIQVWRLGSQLTWIALTGETVVDYSLAFKEKYGWNTTWVCGYNNDLLSYVPSLRVLREGGYEGTTGMHEYGHRAPYDETVQDRITQCVQRLVDKIELGGVD